MKKLALLVGAAVLLAGCSQSAPTTTTPTSAPVVETTPAPTPATGADSTATPMTVTLTEQNKSGESGTATLEEVGGKVIVTVSLNDSKSTVPQPAHIHVGACPNPGAVKFPLTDIVNGKSVTTISTTLAALEAGKPLAINLHKSAADSKTYTACGDL